MLATNRLDKNKFSADEMLLKYKEQQSAERGFSLLKDPLFFADSVFFKTPKTSEFCQIVHKFLLSSII